MCGIVGIAQSGAQRRFIADDVRRMADAIVHRGPDDEGVFDSGDVILGMRRLSIIDLAGGHQPISNEDGSVWVVCNGEIYNFQHLRSELLERGHRFATRSDTEVLVHAYEEYGDAFLERLDGMYGFALWDARKKKLFIARDRLGMKPVYYSVRGGALAFSSEVKALLTLPGFRASLDRDALQDYLAIGYAVAPRTLFEGVLKLPPATVLVWHEGDVQLFRYWEPPSEVDVGRSADEWVEIVRAELERAITAHMISDVPIGAFLSGGIDSSAVAVLMSQRSSEPLNTYSIGYAGGRAERYYNELPYARMVAEQIGSNHRQIEVRPDVARLLPKLMWHLEEPISDSATATTYLVSELAAQSVKVILSGVGGDELFAGYNRYLGGHYSRRYNKIPQWARRVVLPRLASVLPSGRQNRLMDVARYAKRFIRANDLDWRAQYRLYVSLADDDVLANVAGVRGEARSGGFDRILGAERATDELLRLLRVDLQTQLAEDLLLLTDKMTMACSIECRVPFLDRRLVEVAASIPADLKMPDGRLKSILKHAVRDVLPESIAARRKRGFGAPVGAWLKAELAHLRAGLLGPKSLAARGLLDAAAIEKLCAAHDANREDYSDLIFVLLNLEIWCRLFLDGRSHEQVASELADMSLAA